MAGVERGPTCGRFAPLLGMLGDALRTLLMRVLDATRPRSRSVLVLVAALVVIPVWQHRFIAPDIALPNTYANFAGTGIHGEQKFFFFLYHLGIFPLMTTDPIREDSKREALRLLEHGDALLVDEYVTFRSGDRGRTYLYYVDAWLNHRHIAPKLVWANWLGFSAALFAIFAALWWIRMPVFGAVIVTFLGSDPFQLYSTYRQENVFGWPITVALLLMALHVPSMIGRPRIGRWTWALPIAAGVLLATARTVRSEASLMALSALMVYLTFGGMTWKRRGLMCLLFVVTLSTGTRLYSAFFAAKFDRAHAVMVEHGGTPYTGPLTIYHEVWHALYCGLGDFDTTHGYKWDDREAYAYAYPILKSKYGFPYTWSRESGKYTMEETYDGKGKYPIFFGEQENSPYPKILRDKIIRDIKAEPGWFAGILAKRVWRILTETPPVSIHFGKEPLHTKSEVLGVLCVPLALLLALQRRWTLLKVLAFTLPLSAPAFIVFSGKGMTMYATYHYFGAVIMLTLTMEGVRQWLKRRPYSPAET
jgi:hypothetical protein